MTSIPILRTFRSRLVAIRPFQPQRSFITLPGTEAVNLSETRILPYKHTSLYALIADIDSYSEFLPYCQESRVTQWSKPDASGRKWPTTADLKIGWGGYEEIFTSKLFCVPDSVVEALGGDAQTTVPKELLEHQSSTYSTPSTANDIFRRISTKWTVKPLHYKPTSEQPQTDNAVHPAQAQTEVKLAIEFQFSNPVYAALSKAVAPKVAGVMIQAFETRARSLLDRPSSGKNDRSRLHYIMGGSKAAL